LFFCISKLNEYNRTDISQLRQFPPWFLLLLIKWCVIHGDFLSPDRKHLTDKDFAALINLIHDLNGYVRLPSHYDTNFLFFRNIAYQQVWFQERNFLRFVRQSLIFGGLTEDHEFRRIFYDKKGLTIEQFIDLGFMIFGKFLQNKGPLIEIGWFRLVNSVYPTNLIDHFLSKLSHDIDSLRAFLTSNESRYRDVSYEFHEQTPLKEYPLLKYQDKYYCYSKELLFAALNDFIYDSLRGVDPQFFMNKFGSIFESYVNDVLSYSEADFISEKDLKQSLTSSKKVVDFLVYDSDSCIFIDAKGVELAFLGMVSHKSEVVEDKSRSSVIKAIAQGYETAANLAANPNTTNLVLNKDRFLLVVTYKDLYLGNGQDFYQEIAGDKLHQIVEGHGGQKWIPFQHIYFISIDDLELMIQCAKDSHRKISDLIRFAVSQDETPINKKLIFRDHIYSTCDNVKTPSYLSKEIDRITNNLARILKSNENK